MSVRPSFLFASVSDIVGMYNDDSPFILLTATFFVGLLGSAGWQIMSLTADPHHGFVFWQFILGCLVAPVLLFLILGYFELKRVVADRRFRLKELTKRVLLDGDVLKAYYLSKNGEKESTGFQVDLKNTSYASWGNHVNGDRFVLRFWSENPNIGWDEEKPFSVYAQNKDARRIQWIDTKLIARSVDARRALAARYPAGRTDVDWDTLEPLQAPSWDVNRNDNYSAWD